MRALPEAEAGFCPSIKINKNQIKLKLGQGSK
jgi:hypothetical protein